MKKIIIAYHAYVHNNKSLEMIISQLRLLISSGLFKACDKLYIGIIPNNIVDKNWLTSFWENIDDGKVEVKYYDDNNEETDTLKWIKSYSQDNPNDHILYFHTKGVTKQNEATEDWRKYMEYFVVKNWKNCITKLNEGIDACGVLWNSDTAFGHYPHFSGGMWWANTSYINTLKHEWLDSSWRYHREFWIGSNPNINVHEFHNSRMNDKEEFGKGGSHYDKTYPEINYKIN